MLKPLFTPHRDPSTGVVSQKVDRDSVYNAIGIGARQVLSSKGHRFPQKFHLNSKCDIAHTYCTQCQKPLKITSKGEMSGSAATEGCNGLQNWKS